MLVSENSNPGHLENLITKKTGLNKLLWDTLLAFIFKFYLFIDIYSEAGQRSLKNFNHKDGLFGLLIYLLILYI